MSDTEQRQQGVTVGERLGSWIDGPRTHFAVHAVADELSVVAVDPRSRKRVRLDCAPGGESGTVWSAHTDADLSGWSYWYELERSGESLGGVIDPYARLVVGDTAYVDGPGVSGWDGAPATGRPTLDPADAIIYELHVRDFTRDPRSGVDGPKRGRFLGLAQSGTTLRETAIATGLDHLVELGVNVVQLMPVASFATPHQRWHEWGYMPLDWFAPHSAYATGVEIGAAAREFHAMVDALHERGIRVVLDVVFNHNAETPALGARSLAALDPHGYFRRWDDGALSDGAGCGNEFASETPFGRKLIRDACRYWVDRFGVDGFRFDLMGLTDRETLELVRSDLDEVDPSLLMYGEAWAAAPSPHPVIEKGFQKGLRIGVFNDGFRDVMRGSLFDGMSVGVLGGAAEHAAAAHAEMLAGVGPGRFAEAPTESVQYMECHDDHALVDRLTLSAPDASAEWVMDGSAMGALMLTLTRGLPFIHSGQEFGRSKQGVSNTYDRGDDLNNIRWSLKRTNHRLFRHYRRCLRLRREHLMFRPRTGEDALRCFHPLSSLLHGKAVSRLVGAVVEDWSGEDPWARCLIAINPTDEDVTLPPLEGEWRLASAQSELLDDSAPGYGAPPDRDAAVAARGFVVLYEARSSAAASAAS